MTEEPNIQNNSNPSAPETEKLLIDNPSNFQFHAAYMVYEETFDKASEDAKKEINQDLEDLQAGKIDCETFYTRISRFRHLDQPTQRGGKFTVTTQRKKDWRMKTQRQERIKRHKK